jgi:PBSX family phage terminase large subunit
MNLTPVQRDFAASKFKFPAFIGGFGSGKTHAGIMRAISLKSQIKEDVAYYLPTYDLVRTIAYPRFTELLEHFKIKAYLNKAEAVIYTPDYGGLIRFRTMDNPERIVGFETAHSIVDELDTLSVEKARDVWNKIIARNRKQSKLGNSVAVTTTPEGFKFVYEMWAKSNNPDYKIYKAKTRDNPYLPEGYVESLESIYPSNLLSAYLDGEFVNLTAGSVYPTFDRKLNETFETIKDGEPLHIGMDFNVTNMSAVIHVLRNNEPHAVKEYTGVFDTPTIARMLKERYKDKGHAIYIYPDASGNSRKSQNASESDIAILRHHGFNILVNNANPAVKDRVLSANSMIESRKYRVNPDTCPSLVEALERQAYDKNGEPDKTSGFDHVIDSATYFIAYRYPIQSRSIMRTKIMGI